MPDVNDILNQYIADTPSASLLQSKMSAAAEAARQKKAQLAPQGYRDAATRDVGYGNEPTDPLQLVDPVELIARASGDSQYMQDASRTRSTPQILGDSFNSAVQPLFTMPIEIANIGISAVSPDAGAAVTNFVQDGLENAQSKQSDALNARRRAYAARNEVTSDINQIKYDEEVGQDGELVAGLRRVGRDVVDSFTNVDGVMASDLIANAAGSLVAAGPLGKGLALAGKAGLKAGMKTGAVGFSGAKSAISLGSKAQMPLAIGLMESGGVHHQTSADILNMSHEDLAANSPEYQQAIAEGYSPDEARNLVARNAGLEAAAMQFPAAAATGILTGKFEKAPFKPNSLVGGSANVLKEGVEEGVQSATGQLSQNVATRDHANENQDLLEGVGEQAGLGAIGGIGSAGVVQAPGVALTTAAQAVTGTAKVAMRGANAVADKVVERYNSLKEANEKASPVSDDSVRSAVDEAAAASPDVEANVSQAINESQADESQKARATNYVSKLLSATTIGEDELTDPAMKENVRNTLVGSKDRLDAMQRLATLIEDSPEGSAEQLNAAATLYNTIAVINDALEQKDAGALDKLADDHPAMQMVRDYQDILGSIRQSASVAKAMDRLDAVIKAANENGELSPVSEAELDTPEGKQKVRNTIVAAETSPLNGNLEAGEQILRHAEQGKINITPAQRVALQAQSVLLKAQAARLGELKRLGLTTNRDVVSEDVLTRDSGEETKQLSVNSHIKRIVAAARAGDNEAVAEYLNNLVRFAQHMQNKVDAMNKALETGANSKDKTVRYKALTPNGRFMQSPEGTGMWVNPYAPGSVKTAQAVGADAAIVTKVANDMVAAFPDLGVSPIEAVSLDQSLTSGTAEEVAKAYREGRAKKKAEAKAAEASVEPSEQAQAAARRLSDTKLEMHFDRLSKKKAGGEATPRDLANLKLLTEERDRRKNSTPEPAETGQPEGGDKSTELTVESYVDDYIAGRGRDSKEHEQFAANNGPAIEAEFQRRKEQAEAKEAKSQETESEAEPKDEQPSEQSPVVEEKPEAGPATEDAPAPLEDGAAEAEPKRTIAALFPKLPEWSWLKKVFRVPEQPRTRIIGTEAPLDAIKKALSSAKALLEHLGSELKHDFNPEIARQYEAYLEVGDSLKTVLADRLQKFLDARYSKKDSTKGTNLEQLLAEAMLPRYARGKVLNLVDDNDGKLTYNNELLETAILAALQWLLVADRFQSTDLDEDAVAKILKIPTDEFNDTVADTEGNLVSLTTELNKGLGTVEAKRSLARMIKSYWGLSDDPNAPTGQLQGIPEAMASELLHALVQTGALEQSTFKVTAKNGLPDGEARTMHVFVPITKKLPEGKRTNPFQNPENPIYAFPDAIEQAVLMEPEPVHYIGEAPTKVAETQLHNPDVKLTEQQQDAIRFEQKQKHFANVPVVNLFTTGLGLNNVLKLFAAGDLRNRPMNVMDRKSKDGLNRTFGAAYVSMARLKTELENVAGVAEVELDQLPIYYDYAFNRMNRMQMLGANNPQSSKLMREAFLPTRATVDLSNENSEDFGNFALALAQALGVKIHNISREDAYQQVSDLLANQLAGSVNILKDWLKDQTKPLTAEQVDTLKSELGKNNTPVAIHALTEFARYQNADEAGRQAFTTSLYVEADGVTNGPGNAMVLLTPGKFTVKQLTNLRKVGLFVGVPGRTMNEHRQFYDGADLYQESSDTTALIMADLANSLPGDSGVGKQLTALSRLMSMFLKDVAFDGQELTFERGVAKNPLTITIYGSAAKGIAGKVTHELTAAIYERFSEAMRRKQADKSLSDAEAMFPNAIDKAAAEKSFEDFRSTLDVLTTKIVFKDHGEFVFAAGAETPNRNSLDSETFSLEQNEFNNLRTNVRTLFVDQLKAAIQDTMGDELLDPDTGSVAVLRQAVQVQSIIAEYAFQQRVKEKLGEKAKDPNWTKDDFLTPKELGAIRKELAALFPTIETEAQRYNIANTQSADVDANEFGSSLQDQMRTPAFVNGPSDAGVAGTPTTVIGFGDGMAMQGMSTMEDAPKRTLKIYDGVHLPLDNLVDGSQKANQAVFGSWMGNPLAAVSKSYTAFLEALAKGEFDALGEAQTAALTRALNLRGQATPAAIEQAIRAIGPRLERMSLEVEARHKALARVGLSVDQMAGISSPYTHEGEISLEGLSDEQIISELNRLAREEYDKLKKSRPEPKTEPAKAEAKTETAKPVSENIAPELESVGRLLKNGARVVSHTALRKLVRSLNIPSEQRAVLGDVLKTLTTKGYKIVYGSPEQVQAYADERGLDLQADASDEGKILNGFIIQSQQTIYLYNPSSEVLLHELIHAATFDKIQAYYAGESLGTNAVEQVRAIQRLEKLMEQFLGLNMHNEDEATQKAFFDATDEIEFRLGRGEKAAALNEFMAWALANGQLQALQKKTEASPLVQLARKVVEMIKRLVAGKRQMPAVASDMFSNLRFNTNVLMQSKLSENADPRKAFARTVLFHNQSYGNDQRLVELNKTLNRKVVRYLHQQIPDDRRIPDEVRDRWVRAKTAKLLQSSEVVFDAVDSGFTMTLQERTTFQFIVTALMSAVELDPNVLTRVQELYTHVVKNLHVDNFLADEDASDPVKHWIAEQKVNLIVGDRKVEFDERDRSTLLPTFLALAVVNNEFRSVLAKMDLPKSERRTDRTFDAVVDNFSEDVLDKLTVWVSGEKVKSPHVQASIDALVQRMIDTAQERESYFDQISSPLGNAIDGSNDFVTKSVQTLAEKTLEKADEIKAGTDNKLVQLLASAAKGLAGVVDERTGSKVAEGLMASLDRNNVWKPLHDLINNIVGRTESNASIYDMIKIVGNMVQQHRQQYRENLPKVIAKKFSRKVTDAEWTAMHDGLGKTDLAALRPHLSMKQIVDILGNPKVAAVQTEALEKQLRKLEPKHSQLIQEKAKQLAHYMNTGEHGHYLLRNANAVANLFGQGIKRDPASEQLIDTVDQLTTLYAFEGLSQETKDMLSDLAQKEAEGVGFIMDYLVGQRKDEMAKTTRNGADANYYKGAMPVENLDSATVIVADDAEFAELTARSFIRVGDYKGSSADPTRTKRGYYYAPVSGRAVYNQGIFQSVRQTAYGIDLTTGFTHGLTAGRIVDPVMVKRITQRITREHASENLLPVHDSNGQVVAYERSIDPKQLGKLKRQTDISKVIGIWRGRQFEEAMAQRVNETLVDRLHDMWERDIKENSANKARYVDLRDPKELEKDPVLADSVRLWSADTNAHIDSVFGQHFYVRRDMLEDATGYRSASIGDAWTGTSRMPKTVLDGTRKLAMSVFGNKAYQYTVGAEKTLQNLVNDARVMIVVKSIVVPVTNLISNVRQLWGRGVPIGHIIQGMPKKMAEVNAYLKSRLRLDELEAELRAATEDPISTRKLKAEMQSIEDAHRRLSIWPLIEAGEFSSISDGTLTHDDMMLTDGRLTEYFEKLVDKLPGPVRELGRYAIVSKETALFRALQRSVEYGDFLAKAVLYDDLTKRKKMSQKDALGRITDEFVNYARLPGRARGYLESIGLLWFWNFKVRSVKVALSMIRNNPVHSLLANALPIPDTFGSVGSPMEDNLVSMGINGRLGWSTGPGMGLRAPTLNPWFNLVS